jgi:hypothetical protein
MAKNRGFNLYLLIFQLVVLLAIVRFSFLFGAYVSSIHGNGTIYDVSWPNCSAATLNLSNFGIVGVNGGVEFSSNPCLQSETTWFNSYAVYLNTSYPGGWYSNQFNGSPNVCSLSDSTCLSYDYGYNSAQASIKYADLQNVHAKLWLLDVETANSWSNNTMVNRANLMGMMAAIKKYDPFSTVGFYSTYYQYNLIVGDWQNGDPGWLGTGLQSADEAADYCSTVSFTGGPVIMTQYTLKLDQDYVCSGQSNNLFTD